MATTPAPTTTGYGLVFVAMAAKAQSTAPVAELKDYRPAPIVPSTGYGCVAKHLLEAFYGQSEVAAAA